MVAVAGAEGALFWIVRVLLSTMPEERVPSLACTLHVMLSPFTN
jgi:hypothetical protein